MDRRFQKEKRRVIFLVDNCPGHGHVADLQAIRLEFLPANTTAKLQPMDQGVISSLKRHYRRSLLQRMLLCMESDKQYTVDLLTAHHLLTNAWSQVTDMTTINSFRHAGFVVPECSAQDSCEEDEEEVSLVASLGNKGLVVDIGSYVTVDEDVPTCREDTLDTLIDEVLEVPSEVTSEDDEDASMGPAPVANDAADLYISSLRNYFEQHEGTEVFLRSLGDMASFVAARRCAQQRQTSIMDWIKPSKST